VDAAREQLLAPLDKLEKSIQESNLFAQPLEQARTWVDRAMDTLDAQVRSLAA
jgi:hypothetical protein